MFEQFEIPAESLPWIHLLWTVPAVIHLCGWGISRRRRTLAIFGYDTERSSSWVNTLQRRRWSRAVLLAASLLFLTAAAIQPRCDPERTTYKTSARDIAIILDVSRSMLADDLQPSRLEHAKLELARLLDSLEGDRVGLITFAGDAVVKCPLTANYSYFKRILRTVTTHSVPQGGTKIGDAVRKALRDLLGVDEGGEIEEEGVRAGETVMEEELRGRPETFADILIITDGEDHESYPEYAARQAARLGVGIYAVGLGSEKGTPIPTGEATTAGKPADKYIRSRDGEVVLSRLDSTTLQTMVNEAPRGQYLPVGTYNFDLVSFFKETLAKEGGRDVYEKQVFWTEIYQPFLFTGLLLYLLYLLLPERPRIGQLAMEKATEETV